MITLFQLYDLGKNIDIDIFGGITLPENSPLNRETLINSIIEHCGLNIPIYNDPRVFYNAVALWSDKNQYTFKHVGKIYEADYSPIENKYYIEEVETDRDRDMTDNTTGSKTENTDTTNNIDRTVTNSGSDVITDEQTTSALNASTYQPNDKNVNTSEYGKVTTDNTDNTATIDKEVSSINDKTIDETENTKTSTFGHGNVGVTSNNALQIEDYEMIAKYNPYTFLAGLFENDLTLFIY